MILHKDRVKAVVAVLDGGPRVVYETSQVRWVARINDDRPANQFDIHFESIHVDSLNVRGWVFSSSSSVNAGYSSKITDVSLALVAHHALCGDS